MKNLLIFLVLVSSQVFASQEPTVYGKRKEIFAVQGEEVYLVSRGYDGFAMIETVKIKEVLQEKIKQNMLLIS